MKLVVLIFIVRFIKGHIYPIEETFRLVPMREDKYVCLLIKIAIKLTTLLFKVNLFE